MHALTRRKFYHIAAGLVLVSGSGRAALPDKTQSAGRRGARWPVNMEMKNRVKDCPMDEDRGESESSFPLLEVHAPTYRELGQKIGQAFSARLKQAAVRRASWLAELRAFALADRKVRLEVFIAAMEEHFPWILEELTGLAEGADMPFEDLLLMNINPELAAMMKAKVPGPGCTTVAFRDETQIIVAHNEDGNTHYRDLMMLVRVSPPSGVRFLSVCYPGFLPGNGPGINDRGITHTVNFIGAKAWRSGVPRYVIDRAMLEARDSEEALKIGTHPARAYSQHHLIGSANEGRLLALETVPDRHQMLEINGFYAHANHLVLEQMKDIPQFEAYHLSSWPRQETAEQGLAEIASRTMKREELPEAMMGILMSHKGWPICPCRHPDVKAAGCTLAAALFHFPRGRIRVYRNNPCARRFREYPCF